MAAQGATEGEVLEISTKQGLDDVDSGQKPVAAPGP